MQLFEAAKTGAAGRKYFFDTLSTKAVSFETAFVLLSRQYGCDTVLHPVLHLHVGHAQLFGAVGGTVDAVAG